MTYTVVARDPKTGVLGLSQATGAIGVASRCPKLEPGVAVLSAQHASDWRLGFRALDLTRSGLHPREVISALSQTDAHFSHRQLGIVDHQGQVAVHTGADCTEHAGHSIGEDFLVMGNWLTGPQVLDAMHDAFLSSRGDLEERLLLTVEAGHAAGGEGHLPRSADLMTAEPGLRRLRVDLRVDAAAPGGDAVADLRRIYDEYQPLTPFYNEYWMDHPTVSFLDYLESSRA